MYTVLTIKVGITKSIISTLIIQILVDFLEQTKPNLAMEECLRHNYPLQKFLHRWCQMKDLVTVMDLEYRKQHCPWTFDPGQLEQDTCPYVQQICDGEMKRCTPWRDGSGREEREEEKWSGQFSVETMELETQWQ